MPGPSRAERITEVVLCALCIVGAIIFAVWARTLLTIFYAAAVVVLAPFSLYRSRKLGEEEMIRCQDKLMEKIDKEMDDPRKMAGWVP